MDNRPKRERKSVVREAVIPSTKVSGNMLGALLVLGVFCAVAARAQPTNDTTAARQLFMTACAPCHSKDGTAQTPAAKKLGVKNLSLSKLEDAQIIQQILEGRQENQPTTKMPAFKEKLSREQIESLVPIVKEFRNGSTATTAASGLRSSMPVLTTITPQASRKTQAP